MDERTEILIRELSEKLGVTAEQLWGVLIAQAPIAGYTFFAVMIVLLAVAVVAFCIGRKHAKKDYHDDFVEAALLTMAIAFGGIFFVVLLCYLDTAIAGIINPEYWALMKIWPN